MYRLRTRRDDGSALLTIHSTAGNRNHSARQKRPCLRTARVLSSNWWQSVKVAEGFPSRVFKPRRRAQGTGCAAGSFRQTGPMQTGATRPVDARLVRHRSRARTLSGPDATTGKLRFAIAMKIQYEDLFGLQNRSAARIRFRDPVTQPIIERCSSSVSIVVRHAGYPCRTESRGYRIFRRPFHHQSISAGFNRVRAGILHPVFTSRAVTRS